LIRSLPRRDLLAIAGAMLAICFLSWWYLTRMDMPMPIDMDMPMSMPMKLSMPEWDFAYFQLMLLMWLVMMIGMMTPSVAPAVLIYAGVARRARKEGQAVASSMVFLSGYLLVWALFSLLATLAQWGLDELALLSPMMAANSAWLGASLLIAAGIYQLLPIKDACLQHCRNPVYFISENWSKGALRMGFHHGLYCVGCCWVLMGLLFVGGVMNLLWIAGITLFVLAEKLLPGGRYSSRLSGALMIAAGVWLLSTS
jgi:predicted metal-binding membrane protein